MVLKGDKKITCDNITKKRQDGFEIFLWSFQIPVFWDLLGGNVVGECGEGGCLYHGAREVEKEWRRVVEITILPRSHGPVQYNFLSLDCVSTIPLHFRAFRRLTGLKLKHKGSFRYERRGDPRLSNEKEGLLCNFYKSFPREDADHSSSLIINLLGRFFSFYTSPFSLPPVISTFHCKTKQNIVPCRKASFPPGLHGIFFNLPNYLTC